MKTSARPDIAAVRNRFRRAMETRRDWESLWQEVRSEDAYVRRWRPTFGYAVALTWIVQVGGLVYAIIRYPAQAGTIIEAMGSLTIIWGVALSVLGVNAVKRSADKAVLAGQTPRDSALSLLLKRVFGKQDKSD